MSRFIPLAPICAVALFGPLLAQTPSVRFQSKGDSGQTVVWVSGLAPFEGFDLALTQRQGSLKAPLLRGRRLHPRANGSGRYCMTLQAHC